MTTLTERHNLDQQLLNAISSINLDRIIEKLSHPIHGKGWHADRTQAAATGYRRFLYLTKKYPDLPIIPSSDIDEIWHAHILDTRSYAQDCIATFGQFIHHDPFFGMGNEEVENRLRDAFEITQQLYEAVFSEPYEGLGSACKWTVCRS